MEATEDPRFPEKFLVDCKEAVQLRDDGSTKKAKKTFKKLLTAYAHDNSPEHAVILIELAKLNIISAKFETSLRQSQQSLEIAKNAGLTTVSVSALLVIGKCYVHLGRIDEALKTFLDRLEIVKRSRNSVSEAETYLSLVDVYTSTKVRKAKKALEYVECCDGVLSRLPPETEDFVHIAIYSVQVHVMFSKRTLLDLTQQKKHISQAMNIIAQAEKTNMKSSNRVCINLCKSDIHLAFFEHAEALEYALKAKYLCEENKLFPGEVLVQLSEVYFENGSFQLGFETLEKALDLYTIANNRLTIYDVNRKLAYRYFQSLKITFDDSTRLNKAETDRLSHYLNEAMAAVYLIQSDLSADIHRLAFSDKLSECCQLMQLVKACAVRILESLMIAEQDRAVSLMECITSSQSAVDTKEDFSDAVMYLQRSISEDGIFDVIGQSYDIAVVYTCVHNDMFEGFVVWTIVPRNGPVGTNVKIIPYPWDTFCSILSKLPSHSSPANRGGQAEHTSTDTDTRNILPEDLEYLQLHKDLPEESFRSTLQELYEILVRPFDELGFELKNVTPRVKNVLIVPNSELFLVPFPALMDRITESHMFEYLNISVVPAIRFLAYLQELKVNYSPAESEFVAIGNPTTPAGSGLASLPGAEREARNIAKLLSDVRLLTGDAAKKDIVISRMKSASFVHFACHGSLEERFLALAPSTAQNSPATKANYRLTDTEILQMKLHTKLIVLSACNSGGGKVSGEGIVGLARSFLAAGTKAVLVALWQLPDEATELLMTEFYMNFKNGLSATQSLRMSMLRSSQQYKDPLYWGAFYLIGADVYYSDTQQQLDTIDATQGQTKNPFAIY